MNTIQKDDSYYYYNTKKMRWHIVLYVVNAFFYEFKIFFLHQFYKDLAFHFRSNDLIFSQ